VLVLCATFIDLTQTGGRHVGYLGLKNPVHPVIEIQATNSFL